MNDIIAIIGPSGVGKSSVAYTIISEYEGFDLAHSATTRTKREDGKADEYIYLSEEEFSALEDEGGFLECMTYGAARYGTPKSELQRIHPSGKRAVLVLDLEGAKSLRKSEYCDRTTIVYLYHYVEEIEARLKGRGDSADKVKERMALNRQDFRALPELAGLFNSFVLSKEGELLSVAASILEVAERPATDVPLTTNKIIARALSANALGMRHTMIE